MKKLYPHQRFEGKIKVRPGSNCAIWVGARNECGGGLFVVKTWPPPRKCMSVKKYAYQFYNGPVPANMIVTSKCENKLCVEPNHLILKSRSQVIHESIKAGRWTQLKCHNLPPVGRGEANGNCHVSDKSVEQMRADRKKGTKLILLSRKYNTSISNVSVICREETRRVKCSQNKRSKR